MRCLRAVRSYYLLGMLCWALLGSRAQAQQMSPALPTAPPLATAPTLRPVIEPPLLVPVPSNTSVIAATAVAPKVSPLPPTGTTTPSAPLPAESPPNIQLVSAELPGTDSIGLTEHPLSASNASMLNESVDLTDYTVGTDLSMKAKWKNGLFLESPHKDFSVHVGGRTQYDTTFYNLPGYLQVSPTVGGIGRDTDSFNFRRARLRVDGTMYEVIDFAAEYDFVNESRVISGATPVAVPAVTDLWMNFSHLPVVGNIKVGSFKPFIGLEHLTSSRYLDFMERSFNQDAFYAPFNNGFAPGVGIWDTEFDDRLSWGAGIFATSDNIFGYGVGHEYEYVGRVTMLPYYQQDGRYLVHLGMAGSVITPDEQTIRIRTRDNLRSGPPGPLNPVLADTGTGTADEQDLVAGEFLTIWGPWQLQAEYCASFFQSAVIGGLPRGTVFSQGGYVETLYFLTGEHRPYDLKRGAPDRIIPNENFFRVRGSKGTIHNWGAWQLAARYDAVDLNDSGVNGGMLHAGTFGINWFLNPNSIIQFNYNFTHRSAVGTVDAGTINGFGTRMAMDF